MEPTLVSLRTTFLVPCSLAMVMDGVLRSDGFEAEVVLHAVPVIDRTMDGVTPFTEQMKLM